MLRKIFNYLGIGIALAALTVLSVQLFELFRHYVNGEYGSDNCVHIKTVVEGRPGYSLVHKLFGFCFRFPDPYKAIVILMTTMIILTIVGHSIYIIRKRSNSDNRISRIVININNRSKINIYTQQSQFLSN